MTFIAKKNSRISLQWVIATVLLLLLGLLTYLAWRLTIHPVIPNKIYRSAQLPPAILTNALQSKKIRTVINLRGDHPTKTWYQDDLNVAKQLNITYYNIGMFSYQLPSKKQVQALTYLLMTARQPILLHCSGGADRSGFASAIATILYEQPTVKQSEHQFSLSHFVISTHSVGKLVFPYYLHWLKQNQLPYGRASFLRWLCLQTPFPSPQHELTSQVAFYSNALENHICDKKSSL